MVEPYLKNNRFIHFDLANYDSCPIQHDSQSNEVRTRINTAYATKAKKLNLNNLEITVLPNLIGFYWLEELDLGNNNLTDIFDLPHLENLKWLNLTNNNIEDLTPLQYYQDRCSISYSSSNKKECTNGRCDASCCGNLLTPKEVCKYSHHYKDFLLKHGAEYSRELLAKIPWDYINKEALENMSVEESMESFKITIDGVRVIKGGIENTQEECLGNVKVEVINQGREKKIEHPVKEQSRYLANKVMTGEGVVLQRINTSTEAFAQNNVKYFYISKKKKFLLFAFHEENKEGECSINIWETFKPIDNCKKAIARFDPGEKFTKSFYKKFPFAKNNLFLSYLLNEFPEINLDEEANNLDNSIVQMFKDKYYLKRLRIIVMQKGTLAILKAVIQLIYRLTVEKGYNLEHIMTLAYNPQMFTELYNLSLYSTSNGCAAKILEVNPLKDEALVRCVTFPNMKRTKNSVILGQPYEYTVTCPINQLF